MKLSIWSFAMVSMIDFDWLFVLACDKHVTKNAHFGLLAWSCLSGLVSPLRVLPSIPFCRSCLFVLISGLS